MLSPTLWLLIGHHNLDIYETQQVPNLTLFPNWLFLWMHCHSSQKLGSYLRFLSLYATIFTVVKSCWVYLLKSLHFFFFFRFFKSLHFYWSPCYYYSKATFTSLIHPAKRHYLHGWSSFLQSYSPLVHSSCHHQKCWFDHVTRLLKILHWPPSTITG